MLIVAIVCMLIAVIGMSVGICFIKENKTLLSLLSTFALVALICLGVCVATYKSDFSGFSILLIISICPLFVNICLPNNKEENLKENSTSNLNESFENNQTSIKNSEKVDNNAKFGAFLADFAQIVCGATYLLSALAITFCGLYIGKESAFAFLLGISIGLALTFLDSIITNKNDGKSVKKLLLSYAEKFLIFTSVGLLIGGMLLSLLYSLSISHILFALGCFAYATHLILQKYFKNQFNHLAYFAATILLLSSIMF